jgi:hypothetical protein
MKDQFTSSRPVSDFSSKKGQTFALLASLLSLLGVPMVQAQNGLVLAATNLVGGAGNQRATGVSISGGALYFSGTTDANGTDGIVARVPLPMTNSAALQWSTAWPGLASGDEFNSIGVSIEGVYLAGNSYNRTTDTVGGKENKGITVKFPLTGATGGGFGGSIWDRQTPAAPGAFAYGGGENLNGCVVTTESGVPGIYATGSAQVNGANGGRLFLSKLDTNSNVLWTRDDSASMVGTAFSVGEGLTTLNGYIYALGFNADSGGNAYLRKYDSAGNLIWARFATNGVYYGATALGGAIFAVGNQGSGASANFLIDKWDEAGNLLWSRQFDRASAEDGLKSVVALNGHLYAAGYTRGTTAGGSDAAVLEFDPANGNLLSTTLYGGTQDDFGNGIATDGSDLYVAGETRSFVAGGNTAGQNDAFILRYRAGAGLTLQHYAGLTINGSVGGNYQIQYVNTISDTNWVTLTNLTLTTSPYLYFDASSAGVPTRFYRAVLVP